MSFRVTYRSGEREALRAARHNLKLGVKLLKTTTNRESVFQLLGSTVHEAENTANY